MLNDFLRDLRYATRLLAKSPAFTVTALLTLALCIGANTAIYSVVDAVLLRPLPYPQPDRLAVVGTQYRGHDVDSEDYGQNGEAWLQIRDHVTALDSAVFSGGANGVNFAMRGRAEYVQQERVSANFFHVLGIPPLVGREFTRDEDRPGGPAVAVLSFNFWQHVLGGSASAIGQPISLRGEPYTVVGVMPAQFKSDAAVDVWTPLRATTTGEGSGTNFEVIGRLAPGATWPQANAQLAPLARTAYRGYPADLSIQLTAAPLQRVFTYSTRTPLLVLWAAVALVLLIGCVNVSSLLLARSVARAREIATRIALGGGRSAIVRQLLAESAVLACAGGVAGVLLAFPGLRLLRGTLEQSLQITQAIGIDARVLGATAAVCLACVFLFGLWPALQSSRVELREALIEAGARGIAGSRSHWPRRALVITEVALGVVLLIGAGLLIRTYLYLTHLPPGFDPHNVVTARISLQDARYATAAKVNRLFNDSLSRIRQVPGVKAAGVGLTLPYDRPLNDANRILDGPHATADAQTSDVVYVTPGFFEALRIPLVRGRVISDDDTATGKPVALVNMAYVRRYFKGDDPLGFHIGDDKKPMEVVGVAGDVEQRSGWETTGTLSTSATLYVPVSQTSDDYLQLVHTWFTPSWVVRSNASPQRVIAAMQRIIHGIDPQLPFAGFASMEEVASHSLSQQQGETVLLASLAMLALLLAAVGIYGLIANSVQERTRELGIRMALGATVSRAMSAVVISGVALTFAGVVAGSLLALAAGRFLEHLLFGIRSTDPLAFGSVAVLLLVTAALASGIPALRIARLNPATTLRNE